MKKIIIAFSILLTSNFVVEAQQDTLKPVKGDWGFSLNITGLIQNVVVENNKDGNGNYLLFARHYLKNDQALRMGLALNYLRQSSNTEDSITNGAGNRALQAIDSSASRFDFTIAIGLEKHLGTTRRLDPYVGGDLIIGRIGGTTTNINTDVTDVTGTAKTQQINQQDGGFTFGLRGVAGFNFFLSKNLSLGAEFGYAFIYDKRGGAYSESIVESPVSGSQVTSFTNGVAENSQTNLGATATGGIMLSFFF
jgi:hypothetical protein